MECSSLLFNTLLNSTFFRRYQFYSMIQWRSQRRSSSDGLKKLPFTAQKNHDSVSDRVDLFLIVYQLVITLPLCNSSNTVVGGSTLSMWILIFNSIGKSTLQTLYHYILLICYVFVNFVSIRKQRYLKRDDWKMRRRRWNMSFLTFTLGT